MKSENDDFVTFYAFNFYYSVVDKICSANIILFF